MSVDIGPPLFLDCYCLIFGMVLREEFQGSEAEPGPTKQQADVWERQENQIFPWISIKTVPSPE